MKRVFNKEKCINDLNKLNPVLRELSKGWIEMCDGREVINGLVTGDKGEQYLISSDWTDVVEDETTKKIVAEYKTVFSRDLYIEDMDKCVPEVKHAETGWAIDCDGVEVINGRAQGKRGATYVIDDVWTKEVPIEGKKVPVEEQKTPVTDDWLREEPKKEVEKKTKQIFSKAAYLALGDEYYKWIDDCDGAEVIDGMAIGKSGTEYYMCPEWLKEVPVAAEGYKIVIECNDNKTTTAILYKNGEKIDEAIARCANEDTFDLFKGATLALDRLLL